ncbi:MAG: hypothetical protein ABIJ21_03795 [Nanoarchaeota archaeon]
MADERQGGLWSRKGFFVLFVFLLVLCLFFVSFIGTDQTLLDRATGWAVATVNVRNGTIVECATDIPVGQSLFSAYCIGMYENPANLFQNVSGFSYLFEYSPGVATDYWKSYNPTLPNWTVQDLTYVSRLKGYVIGMSAEGHFSYLGILKSQEDVPVDSGYNLISYPLAVVKDINESLSSVYGTYTHVVGYNTTIADYVLFIPDLDNNSLNYTVPFQAYWINMTADGTINFVA